MSDIATLGIRIDSAPAAKAATDLNKLRDAAKGVTAANDNVEKSGVRMAGAMRTMSVAAGAAAVAITALAGVALKKFFSATMEAEQQQAQLAAALRSTGGAAGQTVASLNAHAAALQSLTTYDDEAIGRAQELLLTFTKIGGTTFPRATEAVLDLATRMGGDLQGAAVQLGKALNDPIIGITALNQQGLTFSETQKETIKGLVESGQLMKAQGLILDELAIQTGGAAAALRDTLGGALTGLKNNWGGAFELAGSETNKLKDEVNNLSDAIGSEEFKRAVQDIGSALVRAATTAAVAFSNLYNSINRALNAARSTQSESMSAREKLLEGQLARAKAAGNTRQAAMLEETLARQYTARRAGSVEGVSGGKRFSPGIDISALSTPLISGASRAVSGVGGGGSAGGATKAIDETAEAIRNASEALSEYASLTAETGLVRPQVNALTGEFEALSIEIGDLPEAYDRAAVAAREFSQSAVSSFVQDLRQGVSVTDALTASLGRLIEKMADMALQEYVSGMFGGASGGPLGGLFKAFMPGRAGGGMVNAGQPYQVGEFGRETFIPNVSGRIVPNMQGSGQQQVHVTVGVATDGNGNLMPFVQSVSQQQAAAVVQRAAPQIVNQAVGAVGKNFGQLQSRYQGRVA